MNEVSIMREQYITMEKKVREVNELNNTHVSQSLSLDFLNSRLFRKFYKSISPNESID